jgi:hypothetical protein
MNSRRSACGPARSFSRYAPRPNFDFFLVSNIKGYEKTEKTPQTGKYPGAAGSNFLTAC